MNKENKYLRYWNKYHKEHKNVDFNMFESIKEFLKENNLFSPNLSVLEFGIGNAKNLITLSNIYKTIYACDVCDLALKNVSQLNLENVILVKNYFKKLPLPSKFFDLIFISRTLSTISDLEYFDSTVKELKRIIKNDGVIVIIDYCQSKKFSNSYSPFIYNNLFISKLKPEWSSIPFLHFNEEFIINQFSPLKRIFSLKTKISTCNNNYDDGVIIILKNEN